MRTALLAGPYPGSWTLAFLGVLADQPETQKNKGGGKNEIEGFET
jgi:hypothetical protein